MIFSLEMIFPGHWLIAVHEDHEPHVPLAEFAYDSYEPGFDICEDELDLFVENLPLLLEWIKTSKDWNPHFAHTMYLAALDVL